MYIGEVLDYLKCGKKIRRTIWPNLFYLDKKEDDLILSVEDLLADDWEVVKEKKKWWGPKFDETYWSIKPWTGATRTCYNDHKVDGIAMSMGLCFQTEEQAEFMVEKLKVIHELEKFAYENNSEEIDFNKPQTRHFICYDISDKKVDIDWSSTLFFMPFNIYFSSEEIAKKAIETIGEDRIKKYYFGVNEDGRK